MKSLKLIKRFIQDHPVGAYFLVAFAIPWLPSFFVAGPKFLRGEDIELLTMIIGIAMFTAPILSGILMAYIVDGKRGIGEMFSRMKIWRLGKWYLTVLIFPVFILVVSLLLSATVSSDFAPVFLIGSIMMGIAAGFLEELGWMGFAFPRMRERHGLIRTSVYLGLIHGLWHFPLWFLWEYSDLGIFWFPYFIAFAVMLVALRIIMVWAYSHTNSLLLSQLIHASSTGFLFVLTPEYIEPINEVIFYAVYAVFLGVFALVAIRKMRSSSR
ncbi:MAG: CPBP family intramembrane metalloprotease [Anaerolineales bacterium]|nr:CPBP family intramembrane metalloprotease [Anaerolineales bacterium]